MCLAWDFESSFMVLQHCQFLLSYKGALYCQEWDYGFINFIADKDVIDNRTTLIVRLHRYEYYCQML